MQYTAPHRWPLFLPASLPNSSRRCCPRPSFLLLLCPNCLVFVPTHASIKTSSNFRSPSHVLLLPFQRFKVIPGLAFALFAVLDGLFGAVADARHAVGAVFAPDRFAVFQMDIVQRAQFHALTAADAGVRCPEGIGFYKEAIEHRVYRAAHKAVVEDLSRRRKLLPGSELGLIT